MFGFSSISSVSLRHVDWLMDGKGKKKLLDKVIQARKLAREPSY
jgi:hypothetical protein